MASTLPPAQPVACKTPLEAMGALIALLEREQQALAQPHADVLEAIAGEKQARIREFHALRDQSAGSAASLSDPELRRMTQRAQHLNDTNAKLLTLHRTFGENRLQLLRGGEATNALYRANGYLGQ